MVSGRGPKVSTCEGTKQLKIEQQTQLHRATRTPKERVVLSQETWLRIIYDQRENLQGSQQHWRWR
jgi:hypothetical protein